MEKPPTTNIAQPTLAQIRARLAAQRADLAARYHVREIGIFGSYVRGTQRADSDIDMLVTFAQTPSLFTILALEDELAVLLGHPIDLAVRSALRPHIGQQILRDVVDV